MIPSVERDLAEAAPQPERRWWWRAFDTAWPTARFLVGVAIVLLGVAFVAPAVVELVYYFLPEEVADNVLSIVAGVWLLSVGVPVAMRSRR